MSESGSSVALASNQMQMHLTFETKLHQINPASVKCQCKADKEKGQDAGMITISGDIAKQFQKLPLGTTITIQITQ